jgi:hypothetical protein
MPGASDTTHDACEFFDSLASDKSNFIKTFFDKLVPNYREMLKDVLHPCPFQVCGGFNVKFHKKFMIFLIFSHFRVLLDFHLITQVT